MAPNEQSDPRLHEPTGDEGMPQEFVDTPENLPGDHHHADSQRPTRGEVTGATHT